jgi:four helix bundle protein
MANDERRTTNVERRTSNVERRTIERRTIEREKGRMAKNKEEGKHMGQGNYDLEERLVEFAAQIIHLVEGLPGSRVGNHVGGQLLRSATSPMANHAEAQSAESRADFVHKLKVCLKELRESLRWLRLMRRVPLLESLEEVDAAVKEADELVRIFVKSLKTAEETGERKGNKEEKRSVEGRSNVERRTIERRTVERRTIERRTVERRTVERRTSNIEQSNVERRTFTERRTVRRSRRVAG